MSYGDDEKNPYRVLNDDYEPPVFETEKKDERQEFVGRMAPDNPRHTGLTDHGKRFYWLILPASIVVTAIIILAGMSVGLISLSGEGDDGNDHAAAALSLGVPETILPFDGDAISSSAPELIWAPIPCADSYNIELWHDGSLPANLTSATYRMQINVPLDDTMYSWRVRAVNGTIYGNWSAVSTFTIRTSLDAPELITPENDDMIFNSTLTFSWSDDGISDVWRFQVTDDEGFASILLDVMISEPSITVPLDLEENGTYHWRVMAGWQDIWSEWSEVGSFTRISSTLTLDYHWSFDDEEWNLNVTIPMQDYLEARVFTRSMVSPQSYSVFVTPDQSSVAQIAGYLMNVSTSRNYIPTMQILFAMAFVKAFPYALDDYTHDISNYANFPIETLVEGLGDCEDHAALFVSIVRAMGFDAIQIYMTNGTAGHMSAGVADIDVLPSISSYVLYQGKQYWFCETTGQFYFPGLSPVDDLSEWNIVPVP